jgi:serine/threonine protein kinase
MALVAGSVLQNRYRIEQLLGLGGMGAVYRAYDTHRHHLVAIKENMGAIPGVPPEVMMARRRQFEQEAAMLSRLSHPNIPGVVDHFATSDGNQYLVMDYVEGEDMAQIINQKGALSEAEAIAWIGQVCNALEYLHNQTPPIIHRDIKPQNIKVTPRGQVFLVDFGIAKVGGTNNPTTKGALSVTPGFSPPEQYAMTGTDVRSDIYSLGATLYALLTGRVPPDSISLQSGEVPLVPLRRMNATISPTVQHAVLKAMETRRNNRPQTVDEFWRMLRAGSGEPEAKTIALAGQGTVRKASARGEKGDLAEALDIRRIAGSIVEKRNDLRLILLGSGAIVVLAIVFALSSSKPRTQPPGNGATMPVAAIQTTPIETATETVATATPSPVIAATSAAVVLRPTEITPVLAAQSVAPTEMSDASILATQQAINARATRQTQRFQDCDRIEFEVLQSPIDVQAAAAAVANVELTWRVRNQATSFNCTWGEAGQETQILRAVLVGGQTDSGTPVKLKWIQDDEYDLSLNVQLGPGSYALSWRLLLPNKRLPDGPFLGARISVIALTSTSTPMPTQTPCPVITYDCHCKQICFGRACIPVCDECTREKCD